MPHLEKFYRDYKDKGIILVGFNTSDDRKRVKEVLERHKITFPNIYDLSVKAKVIQFEMYQRANKSGVPLNYLIDRNGKVVEAWYDYEKGFKRVINIMTMEEKR